MQKKLPSLEFQLIRNRENKETYIFRNHLAHIITYSLEFLWNITYTQ